MKTNYFNFFQTLSKKSGYCGYSVMISLKEPQKEGYKHNQNFNRKKEDTKMVMALQDKTPMIQHNHNQNNQKNKQHPEKIKSKEKIKTLLPNVSEELSKFILDRKKQFISAEDLNLYYDKTKDRISFTA